MNGEKLIENKELRDRNIDRVDVLEHVKEILTLANTDFSTVELVSDYYEVDRDTIKKLIQRNRIELELDGLKLYKYNDIAEVLANSEKGLDIKFKIPSRGLILIPKRAILKIGMLLRDSEIAKKVRYLLSQELPELYCELIKENQLNFKKYEEEIGNYLDFTFKKENVKRQVKCGKYYLDFIIFDSIHIEVDENNHSGYDKAKEQERMYYILNNTKYWTIRYNPQKEKPYELMAKIFELSECTEVGFNLDWGLTLNIMDIV
ncbi:hypothetical protein KGF41_14390 [Clostridioides sp. ZZV14-6150]|uniref:hypothetical protein n=1 Tax=Clostridioides sp. ZZV14-6150 TaxID=2811493 RepID=UPI001D116D80|nr:hypothetical protein [Clostridioides sp. ZZV14-6150]